MGLDASAQAAVAAAAVAVAAWLVSLVQILLTRRWRQQDREHALSDRRKDRQAAIQDRQADQQAAQQQRQGDRQAAVEDRQRDRIAALKSHYQSAVQPAATLLLALKQQANDGALWTALMAIGQQPTATAAAAAAGPASAAGATPQLVLPHGVAAEEHKARNLAKGFWEDLVSAMADSAVPPSFGTAEPGDYGAVHFAATEDGDRWFERANNFRELVEPFDIVNWYRSGYYDRTGRHYTQGTIRPEIFQRLQDMKVRQLRSQPAVPGAAQHMYMNSMVWAHAQAGSVPTGSGWAALQGGPSAHPPLRAAPLPPP